MVKNPVGWFEIYVENMDRARSFYESVFNVKLEKLEAPNNFDMEMWSFPSDMEKYGISGTLVRMKEAPPGPGGTMIYFSCEDCAVEEARVAAAGGQVQMPKSSIGEHGFFSMIQDTEGNVFGLHSMK